MKKTITAFICIIMLITSCLSVESINYEYTFIGEGDDWQGEFISKGTEVWGEEEGRTTYYQESKDEFVLEYKGSLKEVLSTLEYSFKTSAGSVSRRMSFIVEPPKELILRGRGGGTGAAKVGKDEVIQVTVKWGKFEESFELYNKDN